MSISKFDKNRIQRNKKTFQKPFKYLDVIFDDLIFYSRRDEDIVYFVRKFRKELKAYIKKRAIRHTYDVLHDKGCWLTHDEFAMLRYCLYSALCTGGTNEFKYGICPGNLEIISDWLSDRNGDHEHTLSYKTMTSNIIKGMLNDKIEQDELIKKVKAIVEQDVA